MGAALKNYKIQSTKHKMTLCEEREHFQKSGSRTRESAGSIQASRQSIQIPRVFARLRNTNAATTSIKVL